MVRASERALEADSGSARAWLARAATLRIIDPTSRRGVIDATRRALRIDSTSADAWYHLGGALGDSLELRESIDAYRRAAAIDPRHTNALAFLAFDYLWLRNYDSARVWADSAVAVDPTGVLARQASGVARRSLGDWTSAKEEYDVIVRRGTGDDQIEGWAGLAELAWMRGERRAADSLLARGVAITDTLNPSLHEAAYLGWAFLATGRRETALRLLQRFASRFDAHFQLHLQGDPMLDALRGDSRFVALLRRGPVLPTQQR
jgi:tetratricopeptide (TPR) repeat protein